MKKNEKDRLDRLEEQIKILREAYSSRPYPGWVKAVEGEEVKEIRYLNKAYEYFFLAPSNKTAEDQLGKRDHQNWPSDIAEQFKNNCLKVIETREPYEFYADVRSEDGKVNYRWRFVKWPVFDKEGELVGVAGEGIPPFGYISGIPFKELQ